MQVQQSINRIRLEFKVLRHFIKFFVNHVLIESDWNLKDTDSLRGIGAILVLIESDWNLKPLEPLNLLVSCVSY